MATNSVRKNRPKKKGGSSTSFKFNFSLLNDKRIQLAFGFFLIAASLFLLVSFTSYLFTGHFDQSVLSSVGEGDTRIRTGGQKLAWIDRGLGIAPFYLQLVRDRFIPVCPYPVFRRL